MEEFGHVSKYQKIVNEIVGGILYCLCRCAGFTVFFQPKKKEYIRTETMYRVPVVVVAMSVKSDLCFPTVK
jgi:hypothetical protein